MKVKLTRKVSGYDVNEVRYKPGDVFEVDPDKFCGDFMQDLTPKPAPEHVEEAVTVEAVSDNSDVGDADITVSPEPKVEEKPKRRRGKSASTASSEGS